MESVTQRCDELQGPPLALEKLVSGSLVFGVRWFKSRARFGLWKRTLAFEFLLHY